MIYSHSPYPFRALFVVFLAATISILCSSSSAQNESAKNGIITGHVKALETGGYLSNAVVSADGINVRTETRADGSYTLFLPPGRHQLTASYTGLDSATAAVNVSPESNAVQEFALSSSVVRMSEFFVRTIREDEALSLQQQRHASSLKTVVATAAFGAPADNPGELLQRIPGINMNYIDGSLFSVSVRGMGVEFAKVAVDGEGVAMSYGNLSSATRGLNIGSLSTSGLSQVELIRAPTPDLDADSISGTINLISKRYYDQKAGMQFNATLSGIKRDVQDTPNAAKIGKFGSTTYSYNNSFGVLGGKKNLGVAFDVAWSKLPSVDSAVGPQQIGTLDQAYVRTASGDLLNRWVSSRETGGPVSKVSTNVSFDYKLDDQNYLFLRMGVTTQDKNDSRWFFRAFGGGATPAAFTSDSTLLNSTTLPTASTVLSTAALNSERESRYQRISTGGEFKLLRGAATLSLLGSYSHAVSKNPYFLQATAQVANVGYQVDARNASLEQPKLVQTAGPSWNDAASYRVQTLTNIWTTGAPQDNYTLKADFKWLSADRRRETKTGVIYRDVSTTDLRISENWTYVGPDGVPNSADDSMTNVVGQYFRVGRGAYGPFPFLPMVRYKEQIAPASYWTKTAAQAYSELTGASARGTSIDEKSPAAYVMETMRFDKVRVILGVRGERTDNTFYAWVRNDSVAWGGNNAGGSSIDPVIVAQNIARANRSYVEKKRYDSSYNELFPGAHLVYEPREGLLLRASYNRSISRPSVLATMPAVSASDDTKILTIGNPALKPYLSDNFELSVEKYMDPVGLVSVNAFEKKLTNYFRTFSDVVPTEGIDGSGLYAGYERRMARNVGSATIKGVELSAQRQFRDLPGFWSGLGAFANFTYLKAQGDFGGLAITTKLPNLTPRTFNAGLSYVGHGWQVRPLINWQSRTYRGTSGTADFDSAARTRVDFKATYAFSKRYTLDVSVFNITDQPDLVYISSDRGLPFVAIRSGTAFSVGVTGRY